MRTPCVFGRRGIEIGLPQGVTLSDLVAGNQVGPQDMQDVAGSSGGLMLDVAGVLPALGDVNCVMVATSQPPRRVACGVCPCSGALRVPLRVGGPVGSIFSNQPLYAKSHHTI